MASITISSDGVEQKVALEGGSVTLGRGLESDVRLKDIKASRRHCQILKAGSGYQCVDLSSGNGTFINGVQIKQQPLNPGDKIQIGSTTITFHDSPAAAPKAAAPAKAPAPAARPSGQTAKVAVAATKKITAKIDVVKPPTAAAAVKPGTQAIARQGTQSIPKSSTAAMKKTTARNTARMGKATASATAKFHMEGAKKKTNPIVMILVGIGVVFVAVVGWILFGGSGGNDAENVQARLDKLRTEAAKAEGENKLDEAIKKLKAALQMVEGSDRFKTDAMGLKAQIGELENNKTLMASAQGRFDTFQKKFETMKTEQANDLYKEGKQIEADYKNSSLEWLPQLKIILERLNKMIETDREILKRENFQNIRNDISDKHKLSRRSDANFSGALRDWREYLKGKVNDENRTKADGAMRAINQQAREELRAVETRVKKLAENGDKTAAADELKKQRPRFETTEVEADFQKLQSEIDK